MLRRAVSEAVREKPHNHYGPWYEQQHAKASERDAGGFRPSFLLCREHDADDSHDSVDSNKRKPDPIHPDQGPIASSAPAVILCFLLWII